MGLLSIYSLVALKSLLLYVRAFLSVLFSRLLCRFSRRLNSVGLSVSYLYYIFLGSYQSQAKQSVRARLHYLVFQLITRYAELCTRLCYCSVKGLTLVSFCIHISPALNSSFYFSCCCTDRPCEPCPLWM